MGKSNTYPIYEARVGALGYVRAWCMPESNTYSLTYFNGEEYTPLFLSEEAAYYTWLFLGMMHPETYNTLNAKPVKKKPAVKKQKAKAK